MRLAIALIVAIALVPVPAYARGDAPAAPAIQARQSMPEIAVGELPREARETLALVQRGGPFPHERDGVAFGNFEKRLPPKERGYYREYTVRTPGVQHRGARRIVTGRRGERYYTDDHYQSFKRITP
jgi:ribonuclease T1